MGGGGKEGDFWRGDRRRNRRKGEAEQRKNLPVSLRPALLWNPILTTRLDVFSKAEIMYCSTLHCSTANPPQDTE